jgi:hypothetical protein
VPLSSFNGNPASAANLWGYVDLDDNREYAIIGLRNGTGIVEVTDPANPVVVATIAGVTSQWREVKVYQFWNAAANHWDAYAYVTTERAVGSRSSTDPAATNTVTAMDWCLRRTPIRSRISISRPT